MIANSFPDEQQDPISATRKGLVSRKLLWAFILIFSAISIIAVVVAFQGKDPIAERQAAEEEKRRQQQASQATGNPADLGKMMAEQARAGRAAKEAATRPSDAALAALTATPALPDGLSSSPSQQVDAYRQRRDAVMAVNLPIYLDEREPRRNERGMRASANHEAAAPPAGMGTQDGASGVEPRRLEQLG